MNTRLLRGICRIIPKINNRLVIFFFELVGIFTVTAKKRHENYITNQQKLLPHKVSVFMANGFIEDQNNYNDMVYGKVSFSYSGCEVIAVYNGLRYLENKDIGELPELIRHFEKRGAALLGKFGTSPKAIKKYFQRLGYKTKALYNESNYDSIIDLYDLFILTIYNDKNDIMQEVHTVAVTKADGGLTIHNLNCNGKVYTGFSNFTEIMQKINAGKSKGIYLIGISK